MDRCKELTLFYSFTVTLRLLNDYLTLNHCGMPARLTSRDWSGGQRRTGRILTGGRWRFPIADPTGVRQAMMDGSGGLNPLLRLILSGF